MARYASHDQHAEPRQTLRVTHGLHRGAVTHCEPDGIVLVGSSRDCDVILSDEGVARHHCLVSLHDGRFTVRAIDAPLQVHHHPLPRGEMHPLMPLQRVSIAPGVAFSVGPGDSPAWADLPTIAADAPLPNTALLTPRRIAVGALATLAATVAVAAVALRPAPPPVAVTEQVSVADVIEALSLREVQVREDEVSGVMVQGVVPDRETLAELRAKIEGTGVNAQVEVRSGDDIAQDVREVLRMSGIGARTRYLGDGRVEVGGFFGDESELAEILSSRAIRDVASLSEVVVVNDKPAPVKPDPGMRPGKKIVSVVRGQDPYIVTADGSRYYVGARLPSGGKLHSISEQEVLIDTGTVIRKLKRNDTHVKPTSTKPITG